MDTPEYIYKYQQFNVNNISALNGSQLWFSDFVSLNDPFEATYNLTAELIFNNAYNFQNIDQTITKIIGDSAVCSFSNISPDDKEHFKTNALMWSHYAGQFSGICIEFNKRLLLSTLMSGQGLEMSSGDVFYSDLLHSYSNPNQAYDRDVMFKKHSAWEYEEEFRIIFSKPFNDDKYYPPVRGLHHYDPKAISRIFIGGRMGCDQIDLLRVVRDNINKDIELVQLSRNSQGYGFGARGFDIDDVSPPF